METCVLPLPFSHLSSLSHLRVVVVSDIFMLGGCLPGVYKDTSLGEPVKLEDNGFLHMPSRNCMVRVTQARKHTHKHTHALLLFQLNWVCSYALYTLVVRQRERGGIGL